MTIHLDPLPWGAGLTALMILWVLMRGANRLPTILDWIVLTALGMAAQMFFVSWAGS